MNKPSKDEVYVTLNGSKPDKIRKVNSVQWTSNPGLLVVTRRDGTRVVYDTMITEKFELGSEVNYRVTGEERGLEKKE